jgi:hypothetical protein
MEILKHEMLPRVISEELEEGRVSAASPYPLELIILSPFASSAIVLKYFTSILSLLEVSSTSSEASLGTRLSVQTIAGTTAWLRAYKDEESIVPAAIRPARRRRAEAYMMMTLNHMETLTHNWSHSEESDQSPISNLLSAAEGMRMGFDGLSISLASATAFKEETKAS